MNHIPLDQINNWNDNENNINNENNHNNQNNIFPLKPNTTKTIIRTLDPNIISSTNINNNNSNKPRYTISLNMFADLS